MLACPVDDQVLSHQPHCGEHRRTDRHGVGGPARVASPVSASHARILRRPSVSASVAWRSCTYVGQPWPGRSARLEMYRKSLRDRARLQVRSGGCSACWTTLDTSFFAGKDTQMLPVPTDVLKRLRLEQAITNEAQSWQALMPSQPGWDQAAAEAPVLAPRWLNGQLLSGLATVRGVVVSARKVPHGVRPVPVWGLAERVTYRALVEFILRNEPQLDRSPEALPPVH